MCSYTAKSQQQNVNRFIFNLHVIIRVIVRAAPPSHLYFSCHTLQMRPFFFEAFFFTIKKNPKKLFILLKPYHC